ncbi:uncharacterized protein BKA55DRAFT_538759 [Fusarium redolens]|uniref:Uncharacterized protein n=1 Tax=Fusarium redolens TaxID=48865 RepID=A0A9P9HAD2_FUSRE|nr:uncharacterized protein BKA55DRAFT_538759 [Fusarium redolens]KAH7253908.1 hypothetical protein BKA55DRAFT_538759 [Fusarium redolens]
MANDCPLCDLAGTKAGLKGPQFCAALLTKTVRYYMESGPAPPLPQVNPPRPGHTRGVSQTTVASIASLNPRGQEFQLAASSTRTDSLPKSMEGGSSSCSNTQPSEKRHSSEEMQSPKKRQSVEKPPSPERITSPERNRSSGQRHPPEESQPPENIPSLVTPPTHAMTPAEFLARSAPTWAEVAQGDKRKTSQSSEKDP